MLLYMVRNIFWGRYRLSLFIIPKDLEIFFCICAFPSHMLINGQPKEIQKVPRLVLTLVYGW